MYHKAFRTCLVLVAFFYVSALIPFTTQQPRIIGSGVVVSKTYNFDSHTEIPPFTQLTCCTSGIVDIKIGSSNQVIVKAEDNILPLVEVYISGNELVLSHVSDTLFQTKIGIQFIIELTAETMHHLTSISLAGSASFSVENTVRFSEKRFEIQNSGSGNIQLAKALFDIKHITITNQGSGHISTTLNTSDVVDIINSGSGHIVIDAGTTHKANLTSNGSGSINTQNLQVIDIINAESNGSGSITCHTNATISATIDGSGFIKNRGHAHTKKIKKYGSGKYIES